MEPQGNGAALTGRVIDGPSNPMVTPLLTDLYQFTMAYAYWKAGKHNERSVYVLFHRLVNHRCRICFSYSWLIEEFVFNFFMLFRFDLYHRKNPFGGEYTVFAGLEECIKFIANFKLTEEEIAFVRDSLPSSCEVSDIASLSFFLLFSSWNLLS